MKDYVRCLYLASIIICFDHQMLLLNRKNYLCGILHKLSSPAVTNLTAMYIASLPCLASFLVYQVLTIPVLRCILVLSIKLTLMAKYSQALQLYFHLTLIGYFQVCTYWNIFHLIKYRVSREQLAGSFLNFKGKIHPKSKFLVAPI